MVIYNMKINNNCLKKRGIIILLKENERIDDLEYKGLKIIQNKKCSFEHFFICLDPLMKEKLFQYPF